MTQLPGKITVRESADVLIIGFVDRHILDEANIQKIGQEISQEVAKRGMPRVIIDFDNVNHLSSPALGTMLTVRNDIRKKDGQLRLANISKDILEIFTITKLDKYFTISNTTEAALKSLT